MQDEADAGARSLSVECVGRGLLKGNAKVVQSAMRCQLSWESEAVCLLGPDREVGTSTRPWRDPQDDGDSKV